MNITAAIEKRSRLFMVCVTLALLGVAVLSRYLVPPQFSVAFLFLLPTSFATWFLSWRVGTLVAVVGIFFLGYFERNVSLSAPAEVYWNTFINVAVAGAFVFIFGELRVLYSRQLELSRRDHLTGLLNRRAFLEFIGMESKRMARHHRPMTIAYIDLDNFKHINDKHGHAAGDEVLVGVGHQISRRLRATDCLARLGGDEFAVLLPETDRDAAQRVLNAIRESLLLSAAEHHWTTFSIGAVTFSSPEYAPDKMIALADRAMYAVKQRGKNSIEYNVAG